MGKLKDFLYYIGDYLIFIIILSLMFFLVTWKLNSTMPIESANKHKTTEIVQNTGSGNKVVIDAGQGDKISERPKEDDKTIDAIQKGDKDTSLGNENESNDLDSAGSIKKAQNKSNSKDNKTENKRENKDDAVDKNVVKDKKNSNKNASGTKVVTVSQGMSGVDIAYMLEEEGIVDSADLFVAKIESMGLSSYLLAGDFKLSRDMSYEEIINVLTGKN